MIIFARLSGPIGPLKINSAQSRQSTGPFLQSSELNWDPHPSPCMRVCLPLVPGGWTLGHTRLRERGWWSQFGRTRRQTLWYSRYCIYVLALWNRETNLLGKKLNSVFTLGKILWRKCLAFLKFFFFPYNFVKLTFPTIRIIQQMARPSSRNLFPS